MQRSRKIVNQNLDKKKKINRNIHKKYIND